MVSIYQAKYGVLGCSHLCKASLEVFVRLCSIRDALGKAFQVRRVGLILERRIPLARWVETIVSDSSIGVRARRVRTNVTASFRSELFPQRVCECRLMKIMEYSCFLHCQHIICRVYPYPLKFSLSCLVSGDFSFQDPKKP